LYEAPNYLQNNSTNATWTATYGPNITATTMPPPGSFDGLFVATGGTDFAIGTGGMTLANYATVNDRHFFAHVETTAITHTNSTSLHANAAIIYDSGVYTGISFWRTGTEGSYQYFTTFFDFDSAYRYVTQE